MPRPSSDRIEGYVPPARGRDHALRIVRDLLAVEPKGKGTNLAAALQFAGRVMKRRGIVAVLSDVQDQGYEKRLGALRRRHDVIALHLADPREGDFPDVGLVALLDPETGGIRGELSNDELHLLGPGYALWKEQVEVQVRTGATPVEPPIEPAPGLVPGEEPEIDEPELEGFEEPT